MRLKTKVRCDDEIEDEGEERGEDEKDEGIIEIDGKDS